MSNKLKVGMIGLEIHVYLITKEKLFCKCKAVREKGTKANNFICPICTGQPGAKPMLPNKNAVIKAVQVGLMLGCRINKKLKWMRKHYNWADLPKGYQNTLSGDKAFPVGEQGKFYGIRIKEMHLEEDPASWEPDSGRVDYNRSGLPLLEIVTEPDFSTSEEVTEWLKKLLHNLQYLKAVASDAGIKSDVNVSIPGKTDRVEVKNVNSLDNIAKTIDYELERQEKEGSVKETRRFDEVKGKTIRMRSKEEAEDYRFIFDPDLKPIILDDNFIEEIRKKIPETPEKKLDKLIKKYKIGKKDAEILSKNLEIVEFFESIAEKSKLAINFILPWVNVELLRHLNYNKTSLDKLDIKSEHFIELLKFVKEEKITELQGKEILNKFYPKSFSLKERGVEEKITDSEELDKICKEVLEKEREVVMRYRAGETKLLNFLVGEVMKKTEKRADFKVVRGLLEKILK